jgi:hypothetical protein
MEKLVERHIRDDSLMKCPLHQNQHAYQAGKSTETALHNVVTRIENAIEHRDIALGAFLDIEGAFDRTSFDTIKQAAERHGIDPTICRWICAMLESRNITATLSGETLGKLRQGVVRREVYYRLCCGAWSWMIFSGSLTIGAITQYDMLMILLS